VGSSKGSSSSTFTPPPEVVAAYKEALGYGRAAMGQQYQPYTGEITAPLTPTQESGIYNVNRAVGTAIPYFGQATQMTTSAANTPITPQQFSQGALEQYMSPYTKYVADATFANLREQQKQEQEALQSGAIRAGAFGGDRAGIAAANMARQQDLATAQAMSNIYNQGYGQAAGLFGQQQGVNYAADVANAARQMQGAQQLAGLGTGLQGSVLQGAQAQLAAGAQQQAVQQAINTGYYNQYLGAQAYPYQQAQFFANLATGVGGQMGGTTTGQQAAPSPVGTIFGALGALGSIMSDKRVKENVKPIGKTNDGQTIYRFNYKGDHTTQIGLLAQEVEKKHPEAVTTINGLKGVDYKEATDDSVRSMGGGVVPTSQRHNFAGGGHTIDEEEDPMVPYVSGVPAKVRQIPKLAKIGGSKPNFGGTPPGPAQGPSAQDFKGAAEGLGKIYDKFTAPTAAEAGQKIIDLSEGFGDVLSGLTFALGGAASARRRFADGEDVPVTPETVVVSEDKPVRVASFGDVERRVDAGAPSPEPVREPAREAEPKVGVVPTMARNAADLPPLFAKNEAAPSPAAFEKVSATQPAPQPVSAGVVPTEAPKAAKTNPIVEMIRAEAERQGVPFEIAKKIAGAESRFSPTAEAGTSSAKGVFQITKGTLEGLGGDYSKVFDPEHNIKHGVQYIGQNYRALTSPDDPNAAAKVYLGHFFGTGGAKSVLSDPNAPIAATLPNYRQAVAANSNVRTSDGKPMSEWTGNDALKWASEKMSANYEPSSSAGLGRARPSPSAEASVAASDRKWNFGMAGEGKRSVIESIMDRDFDPIQKRALFAFFAGMAASPSPWFGQQLGAGMQAASNVYNDSLNKQAELGIRKEQLGLEEQKIGVSKEQAEVAKQNAARQLLASMTETIRNYKMSGVPLPDYIQQLFKQAGVPIPTTAGVAPPAAGGTAGAGVVPVPKAPEAAPPSETAPKPEGGAAPIPTPTPVQPQRRAEAEPEATIQPAAVQEVFAPEGTPNTEKQNVWAKIPNEKNPEYWEAQKKKDPEGFKYYEDRRAKAEEALQKDQGFRDKDGNFIRLPAYEQKAEQERKQGIETKKQEKYLEENMKHFDTVAQQSRARQELRSRNRNLEQLMQTYETGAFAQEKGQIQGALRSMGFDPNIIKSATVNAAAFEQFVKDQTSNSFAQIQNLGLGQRFTNMELQAAQNANSNPGMQPEANRALVGYTNGLNNWMDKRDADAIKEAKRVGYEKFDRTQFEMEWARKPENDINRFVDEAKKNVAVRGGTPTNPRELVPGQSYILEPGQYRSQKLQRAKFLGLETDRNGQTVPKFKLETLQ